MWSMPFYWSCPYKMESWCFGSYAIMEANCLRFHALCRTTIFEYHWLRSQSICDWRRVETEDSASTIAHLAEIFRERGPPSQILTDNGTAFTSTFFRAFCHDWGITLLLRCAYRPSGNAIIERNHRTIKRMAARTNGDPLDMVFWYNMSPMKNGTIPSSAICSYSWRCPDIIEDTRQVESDVFAVGDIVYVKPPNARCITPWRRSVVTGKFWDWRSSQVYFGY